MKSKSKVSQKHPVELRALVYRVQQALSDGCFFVVDGKNQTPAKLLSLEFKDVQVLTKTKSSEIVVHLTALFEGAAPHRVALEEAVAESLGIQQLSLGMGAFAYSPNNTSEKGLSFRLIRSRIEEGVREELATLYGVTNITMEQAATAIAENSEAVKSSRKELELAEEALATAKTNLLKAQRKLSSIFVKELKAAGEKLRAVGATPDK